MWKLTFIIIIILLCGCGKFAMDCGLGFKMKNNSSSAIIYYIPGSNEQYPDTTLPISKPIRFEDRIIEANEENDVYFDKPCRKTNKFSFLPKDTLSIYIFNKQVVYTTSWKNIRDNYLIIKRYDLSYDDLDSLNWTITYP